MGNRATVLIPYMGNHGAKTSSEPPMESATQRLSRLHKLDRKKSGSSSGGNTSRLTDSTSDQTGSDSDIGHELDDPTKFSVPGGSRNSRGSKRSGGGAAGVRAKLEHEEEQSTVSSQKSTSSLSSTKAMMTTLQPKQKKWGMTKSKSKGPLGLNKSDLDFLQEMGKEINEGVSSNSRSESVGIKHVTFGGAWEETDCRRKTPPTLTKNKPGETLKSQLKKSTVAFTYSENKKSFRGSDGIILVEHVDKK